MSHFQVSFFSSDKRFPAVGDGAINVPNTSGVDELNLLVNTIAKDVNDEWKTVDFDFLISGTLLRTELSEFVDTHSVSTENVIKIECILKKPPPIPRKLIRDNSWVSDVKATPELVFSTNYAGELSVWSNKAKRLLTERVDSGMVKCLDVFGLAGERHVIVGVENQFLTLYKQQGGDAGPELVPRAVLRGHQRSVECVAAKSDGGFDSCIKVWNTEEGMCIQDLSLSLPLLLLAHRDDLDESETSHESSKARKPKKSRSTAVTKVPMVTLESHKEVITGVKWNPLSESQAVTVSWDYSAICWELETAEPASTLSSNKAFTSLSLNSISGLMVTGSTDPVVRLWDFRSKEGSMVKESFLGHLSWVSSVCWAPDSEQIFASGSFDKTVKMWDIRSPKAPLYDIMGHEDKVLKVDWSVKDLLTSGSADATIRTFTL